MGNPSLEQHNHIPSFHFTGREVGQTHRYSMLIIRIEIRHEHDKQWLPTPSLSMVIQQACHHPPHHHPFKSSQIKSLSSPINIRLQPSQPPHASTSGHAS